MDRHVHMWCPEGLSEYPGAGITVSNELPNMNAERVMCSLTT